MKNWNSILRWVHLFFGGAINGYFFYTVVLGNTATEMMVNLVMLSGGLAFWTGLAKWQLPRIRKWRKKVNSA
ncbi:hypothetical protein OAV06_03755 [Acidimicrobiia bacterium]|nr:hypothetical protein [Acidimicrobiia bacterium]|tara:strand:- start:106 stop:321 length:216 start_codon:yes stop_codon:yes gene_type:complete